MSRERGPLVSVIVVVFPLDLLIVHAASVPIRHCGPVERQLRGEAKRSVTSGRRAPLMFEFSVLVYFARSVPKKTRKRM